jgi:hypothetical protein
MDKFIIIMKNWSYDVKVDYMCEMKSLDEFLTNEANIIDDNDAILDVVGYYNGDELK